MRRTKDSETIRSMIVAADEALEDGVIDKRVHAAVIAKGKALMAQEGYTWADLDLPAR